MTFAHFGRSFLFGTSALVAFLFGISALSAVSCGNSKDGSTGVLREDTSEDQAASLTVDLNHFRTVARQKIESLLEVQLNGAGRVFFQDAVVNTTGAGLAAEAGCLVYFHGYESESLEGPNALTYQICLSKTEAAGLGYVDFENHFYARLQNSLIVASLILDDEEESDRALNEMRVHIEGMLPESASIVKLNTLQMLIVKNVPLEIMESIAALVNDSEFFSVSVEDSASLPADFGEIVEINSDGSVDLDELRAVAKEYRERGLEFISEPELPAPFGR